MSKDKKKLDDIMWNATSDLSDYEKLTDEQAKAILDNCKTTITFPDESTIAYKAIYEDVSRDDDTYHHWLSGSGRSDTYESWCYFRLTGGLVKHSP